MFSRHEEFTGAVQATINEAFRVLDDPTRLPAHLSRRSWKLGWGKMTTIVDEQWGRVVSSHVVRRGRPFGVLLFLDEVVTGREMPRRKVWETVGEPRLLVIGPYRMGFEITPSKNGVLIHVSIDYELPSQGISRLLGYLLGRVYAKWCTRRMVLDAKALLASPRRPVAWPPVHHPPMREVPT
jgi:hypothetical protein